MSPLLVAALLVAPPPSDVSGQDTLPVPDAYLEALDAGTRSRTGAPGTAYWQQRVDYRIQARLYPAQHRVTGSGEITYQNRSPDALETLWLSLPQNVFAPGNPRNRPAPITGGFTLERIEVEGGGELVSRPGPAGALPTVVALRLAEPLPPGGTRRLSIGWSFEVPEGTFRMGREGSEVFYLAQWYPYVATYDDLRGWAREPYMGDGEFYREYGDFEVEITAPEGWLVSASGVLQNAGDVLAPGAAGRLAAVTAGEVTAVVSREDRDAGRATASGGDDGVLTWRWVAENVRDFAWGASDRYVWDATVARYPGDDGGERSAVIHALYRPERPNWDRSAEYAKHAIEAHSHWYPYPYPQMTVNEGVIGGGMEYPMITIIGGSRSPLSLYGVISHELAHMWWPMVVGSNERLHAWMDEGLASFSEDLFTPTLFPESPGGVGSLQGYLRVAGSDAETESMRPADLYGPFGNRGLASYGKPATVFRALRGILGDESFDAAMGTYVRRWAFKHPHPLDLFWTFEDVTGQDLDWYFLPWLYTTRTMDQSVAEVRSGAGATTVVLEDQGDIAMPVILEVTTSDGTSRTIRRDHDAWIDGRMEVEVQGTVIRVELDPGTLMPDVDRADNVWARSAGGG